MTDSNLKATGAARLHALIPCAGTGTRAGTAQPKQYQPLLGQPMVLHTLMAFLSCDRMASIMLVLAPGDRTLSIDDERVVLAQVGGATRAESVLNGVEALSARGADDRDWVLVHDAARCLVTPQQIDVLVQACEDDPVGGLLALPLPDTLKASEQGRVCATISREDKWLAQTPQMFRLGILRDALRAHASLGFVGITDEASAIELAGHAPLLVRGSAANFKVTYPEDFALAESILRSRI